ncbi:MAG: hypothetical protein Q9161_002793 [Pseudevernia consocians]
MALPRVDPLPTKWTRFDWWTEYSEKNITEVDALWDAILPSHGFVAMNTEWAVGRQWPESMRLPGDESKSTIQCNADSTPLYLFGDDTAGDGQLHKCRDWDALRDFATGNTACYRDSVTPIILADHFGYCDDGNDGVIDAKRANVTVENVTRSQSLQK